MCVTIPVNGYLVINARIIDIRRISYLLHPVQDETDDPGMEQCVYDLTNKRQVHQFK
jgi:hypothetical protein